MNGREWGCRQPTERSPSNRAGYVPAEPRRPKAAQRAAEGEAEARWRWRPGSGAVLRAGQWHLTLWVLRAS